MLTNLSCTTCFTFLYLAEKYEFKDLIADANNFVLENFIDISTSAEFKNISKDALCNYLSADNLNFENNEVEVFEAARRWLEAEKGRVQHVDEVMSKVRFMLISANNLGEISDKKIVENNIKCQKLIRDAFVYQANIYEQPLLVTEQSRPRGKRDLLTIDGGDNVSRQFKNKGDGTTVYHGVYGHSTKIKQVFLHRSLSGTQMNNFLFLFGTDNQLIVPVSMRYSVSINQWIDLKPVPRQATVSSMCRICNGHIYLLGGMLVNQESALDFYYQKEHITSMAHSYSISANEWTKIDALPQNRHHALLEV